MNSLARERKFSIDELYRTTKELLLLHGYEGFTISLLADRLDISRGTLYKYYENKEELITDYMLDELERFLLKLQKINEFDGFESQFNALFELIFEHSEIYQIITIALQIPAKISKKVTLNKAKLDVQHLDMYKHLQNFIALGRSENILKSQIPDGLILGFIFQTIAIPNHTRVPEEEWNSSIKEIICHGMFTKNN
ncbi:TetR/AcrR family transcriptional regulator [Bacillus sp. DTU_2020_1000418_1_SI_GHA_SEK_038]|uniref:TetR/AcrR family transcriptional regulator n=1 Tax=Bacillus sp. DTU_2020_1000418_1_SI_GHA_SEK_038 TaxID=3077585 RepID=UPI0028E82471|nr:TetR/AcrR family transcriptional regulator [Bacillus sp. DTU_2020_1000418_1_SI_GHA_SEK_038]WNS77655.1 TetR/AcrR family transcriptional regulator [Bacillus sp. DTU_2020_1000418_1_SI_GHA_SEK_038]